MKSRLLNKSVAVHKEPNPSSALLGVLRPSDEFTVRESETYQGQKWVSVTLNDGVKGYIPGAAEMHPIQDAIFQQSIVKILAAPDPYSPVRQSCKKGIAFMHAGVVVHNGSKWIEVRTPSGMIGFIPENTTFKMAETAKGKLQGATAAAASIGVISLIIGLIGSLSSSRVLPSWESLVGGAIFAILAFFISQRSRIALGIAVGLWGLELAVRIITFMSTVSNHPSANTNPGFLAFSLLIGWGLLRPMLGGFSAIDELKNPGSFHFRPSPFVDWFDATSENKPIAIPSAPEYLSMTPTPSPIPVHYFCPHCSKAIAMGATTCMFCWGKTSLAI